MTDDRIDYHRNRLRGVPLADLGRMLGEVLRDVAREAAEVERARMRSQTPSAQADAVEALRGATDVLSERRRQIDSEGWSAEHDDRRSDGSIAVAAVCYVLASLRAIPHGAPPDIWPWDRRWWKPSYGRHDLVKAGALILAEIDRIDRAVLAAQGEKE